MLSPNSLSPCGNGQKSRINLQQPRRPSRVDFVNPIRSSVNVNSHNTGVNVATTNEDEVYEAPQLSESQKHAFREVFDLFDSNGGGTIDAQELDDALRSVDIQLSKDEIADVLSCMDNDGNGEIDFHEFLQLMTNTEKFLQSMMFKTNEERRQREVLLFDALTQFMKKAALHSINEIVGYYSNKYKKVQAPHVIRHYAAGARLIGLSEQQIKRHLDDLRENCADSKSPYAQPLIRSFISLTPSKPVMKKVKQPKLHPPTNALDKISEMHGDSASSPIPACRKSFQPPTCYRGRIRLKFRIDGKRHLKSGKKETPQLGHRDSSPYNINHPPRKSRGWVSQRYDPTHNLPDINVGIRYLMEQKQAEKNILQTFHKPNSEFRTLTCDDMQSIRKHVGSLCQSYYNRIQSVRCDKAEKHWQSLAVDRMPSESLRNSYRRAFTAYTEYRNTPVSSLCSRSIG